MKARARGSILIRERGGGGKDRDRKSVRQREGRKERGRREGEWKMLLRRGKNSALPGSIEHVFIGYLLCARYQYKTNMLCAIKELMTIL